MSIIKIFWRAAGINFLLAGHVAALAQPYVVSTVAGGVPPPTPVQALKASLGYASSIVSDSSGNLYFRSDASVFKIDAAGTLTRIAGNGRAGFSGDGSLAVNAQLGGYGGLALDIAGNLYIGDGANNRIRMVSANGTITTIAGSGTARRPGDGGPAIAAQLLDPEGVAVDASGNVYIAETLGNRVRKVSPDGIITTVAGTGVEGYSGDGGPATNARSDGPISVAVDASGHLLIAELYNYVIREVTLSTGIIATVAGNGTFSGDGVPAIQAQLRFPTAIAIDVAGNLFIAEDTVVRKVTASTGIITTVAGLVNVGSLGFNGDNQPATNAQLGGAAGIAVDQAGNLYIADGSNYRIRKVAASGIITTIAGNGVPNYSGDGGPATAAQLDTPMHVAVDRVGNLYISDQGNSTVRKVSRTGVITTVLSTEPYGWPEGVAVDAEGNVYIATPFTIRKVSADGSVMTVGGPELANTDAIAVDRLGNLYIVETALNRVRKFSPDGVSTTIAGTRTAGFSGDGGLATAAELDSPTAVAVDLAGNVYIADQGNSRVRRVSSDRIITTIAGNGSYTYSGDGGPATSAGVSPIGVAVDAAGALYILQFAPPVVRKVTLDGVISTIAGHPSDFAYSGDGGPATQAQFYRTFGLAVDLAGNVYVADSGNGAVRMLRPSGPVGSIHAVANAASSSTGAIAPGEMLVLYGSGIGPQQIVNGGLGTDGRFGTEVGGAVVTFNAIPAPILYAWANQALVVAPYGIGSGDAQVVATYKGQSTAAITVPIYLAAPAMFTVNGAAINRDGSSNSAANPAAIGDVITLFATGEGATTPAGVDGLPASAPFPHPNLDVRVVIGGKDAQVQYAGGAPGIVAGVMQVNAVVPAGISIGDSVPISLRVGTFVSPSGVTIAVR